MIRRKKAKVQMCLLFGDCFTAFEEKGELKRGVKLTSPT